MNEKPGNAKESVKEVRENARRLRRQYLRYEDAEIVYGLSHKKILELATEAGALYRMDRTVLINREIFEAYLEQFHEAPRKMKFDYRKK